MPDAGTPPARLDVLVQAADFKRALATPPSGRSAHFALHHLDAAPQAPRHLVVRKLSTDSAPNEINPVDDLPDRCWLGIVVPKRHARRAATRNLLKRQVREAARRHAELLRPGLWVLRLRAGFDRRDYPSASSDALRRDARLELEAVFGRARRP